MVEWLAISVTAAIVTPFAFVTQQLYIFYRRYPSSSAFGFLSLTWLMCAWCVSAVPSIVSVSFLTSFQVVQVRMYGLCCGILGELVFVTIYAGVGVTKTMKTIAHLASVALSIAITISVVIAVYPNGDLSDARFARGIVELRVHPIPAIFMLSGVTMFVSLLIHSFIQHGRYPDPMVSKTERKYCREALGLFAVGVAIEVLNVFVVPFLRSHRPLVDSTTLFLSRILVAIGFILMGMQVARNRSRELKQTWTPLLGGRFRA